MKLKSAPSPSKMSSSGIWACSTLNCLKTLTLTFTIKTLEFTHAQELQKKDEPESSKDRIPFWPFIAGGVTVVIFLLVVAVCCIVHRQNKRSDQPYYANRQQVRDARKDPIIYENDQECRKYTSKGKREVSSVYINRPENKTAIYVNSAVRDETYANCSDPDYENVE